jgi:hypothetical protein
VPTRRNRSRTTGILSRGQNFDQWPSWGQLTCVEADLHAEVIYRCRNNHAEYALMLLDRGTLDSAALTSVESNDVLIVPGAFDEVVKVLDEGPPPEMRGCGQRPDSVAGLDTGHARWDSHPAP